MIFLRAFHFIILVLFLNNPQAFSSEPEQSPSEKCGDSFQPSSIEDLDLPVRITNALMIEDINSIEILITKTEGELLRIPGIGLKSLEEIKARLAERELQLSKRSKKIFEREVFEIDNLNLPVRITNALKIERIYSIEALIKKTEEELLRIPDIGRKSLEEIKEALNKKGYQLSESTKEFFHINSLGLTTRTTNALTDEGIKSVKDLVTKTEEELLKIPNLGEKSLAEIKEVLGEINLRLGMNMDLPSDREQLETAAKGIQIAPEADLSEGFSDMSQILKEMFPDRELVPFLSRSEIAGFTLREKQVLKLRFGMGGSTRHTLEEIGRDLNLSTEKVEQIQANALTKLLSFRYSFRWRDTNQSVAVPEDISLDSEKWEMKIRQLPDEDLRRLLFYPVDNLDSLPLQIRENLKFSRIDSLGDMFTKVDSLDLPAHLKNTLARNGIIYMKDLAEKTELGLRRIPTVGEKSILALREVLSERGWRLKAKPNNPRRSFGIAGGEVF